MDRSVGIDLYQADEQWVQAGKDVAIVAVRTVQLLLIGGGHGHLHVLKQLHTVRLPHTQVTLVSPSRFQYYSGMFSGYVEGTYSLDDIRIDLMSLAQKANVHWIKGAALQTNHDQNVLFIDNGQQLPFDVISFDIGSLTAGVDIPGVKQFSRVIKPNYLVPEVFEPLKTQQHVVVVGGGAAGVEMSLALQSWRKRHQIHRPVQLISAGSLLEPEGRMVSTKIEAIVKKKGVEAHLHLPVHEVVDGRVITSAGTIPFEELVWLTGPRPHPIFRESGLPVDDHGYLLVKDTLQAIDHPHVFGIGDCITLAMHPGLPKAGVYAVRQARTLWANLKRYLEGDVLHSYRHQRHIMSILSTGQEQGFLLYRGTSFHGHVAWRLKRKIDQTFISQYQQ